MQKQHIFLKKRIKNYAKTTRFFEKKRIIWVASAILLSKLIQ